jgi:hypothetical protein
MASLGSALGRQFGPVFVGMTASLPEPEMWGMRRAIFSITILAKHCGPRSQWRVQPPVATTSPGRSQHCTYDTDGPVGRISDAFAVTYMFPSFSSEGQLRKHIKENELKKNKLPRRHTHTHSYTREYRSWGWNVNCSPLTGGAQVRQF